MLLDHVKEKHSVASTTFALPVRPTRQFGSSAFKPNALNGSGPAVTLSEIAFSVYYPTKPDLPNGSRRYLDWLTRPIKDSCIGLSHYIDISYWITLPIFYFYKAFLKIPVHANGPLLQPVASEQTGGGKTAKWPLVFFCHGLGGSRTAYSHICSRIASSGKVVIVMEHRDGSGAVCHPRSPDTGSISPKYYIKPADTTFGEERKWEFRMDQLALRRFEVYSTYDTVKGLITKGDRGALETINGDSIDWDFLTEKVDADSVQLVGHSFGGATLLSILSNPPPEEFTVLPISHALLLDPWLEPFPSPGPVPYVKDHSVKMAVINSETFTLWKSHFERWMELLNDWNGIQIYTILRCIHMSFSDYPILKPKSLRASGSDKLIKTIGALSVAFLDDRTDECLSKCKVRKMEIEWTEAKFRSPSKKRLVGELGDVIIH